MLYDKKMSSCTSSLVAKDYRTMTWRWQEGPYFRIYGRVAGFKTGDFVEEKLAGLP